MRARADPANTLSCRSYAPAAYTAVNDPGAARDRAGPSGVLDLRVCRLTTAPAIPEPAPPHRPLRVLDLRYNALTSFRAPAFACRSLVVVNASHNALTALEFADAALPGLAVLDASFLVQPPRRAAARPRRRHAPAAALREPQRPVRAA